MAMNLTQKILSAHLLSGELIPGSEISIRIDQTLTQDSTGTMAYLQFEAMGVKRVKTKKSVAYIDHNTLQTGFENADDHYYIQTVTKKHGIYCSKPGNGICHQVQLERFGVPGYTLLGSDSHTPTGGGIGMLAMTDGADYVPMSTPRVFLIQLLNIAGLGPIFGALAGACWGPSVFLWITLGTIFAGAVHDFMIGMMSMRHKGASVSELTGTYLGKFIACVSAEDKLVHYISYMAAETGFPVEAKSGVYSSDSTPFADGGVPALSFARISSPNVTPIHCRYDVKEVMSMEQLQRDIDFLVKFTQHFANAVVCPVAREIPEKIKKELEKKKKDYQTVTISEYNIDSSSGFDTEEFVRDIFVSEENLPDVLVCMDEVVTECVYQALVDYNQVGNVDVVGFYYSDVILDGISKGIISSAIALDMDEIGRYSVNALEEFSSLGHTSNYYSVGQHVITRSNVGAYRTEGN